jgi:hypothetical protein
MASEPGHKCEFRKSLCKLDKATGDGEYVATNVRTAVLACKVNKEHGVPGKETTHNQFQ